MKKFYSFLILFSIILLSGDLFAQAGNFGTSLHNTREGKSFWYDKENGGFETLTNVPIEDMGCKDCHGPTDANGTAWDESNPYTGASCVDCHADNNFSAEGVSESQCLSCHGRQSKERALGYTDVHRDAGFVCWDCHTSGDVHGDGTEYNSMLEPGAIDANCETCHIDGESEKDAPFPDHSQYDPHGGKLDCTTCHAQTVISCYNCHLESQVESHVKRAAGVAKDFLFLVNREKDNKVYPATFQSLTHEGNAWVAFGPFTSHTVTDEGRKCADCHGNENVRNYKSEGTIKFASWNEADSSLSTMKGVIPFPPDYETSLKMDFITYDGNTSDPAGPSKLWSKIGKDTWDGHQLMYASPLTEKQINALNTEMGDISTNFQTSLHKTRIGKSTWYDKEFGGFETLTNVPIEDMGCRDCHGPTDANGVAYDENNPFTEMTCSDCHANGVFDETSVSQDQCLTCHGRQNTEINKMKLPDVHRAQGMVCMDCHTSNDMHGNGTEYTSMLDPGAIEADCETCHPSLPSTHAQKDPHGGKLHCTSCHASTVISCYNCHLESQVEHHVKRAKQPIKDFVILVNREKDNKVYPATFQSLTHEGNAWVAMGPFSAHTITKENARECSDCHANFGGSIDAINEYNESGEIKFATWSDEDSALTWKKGIVPLPADYERSFKMDFITYNGNTSDPAGPSKNWSSIGKDQWDGHQLLYASPLTKEQMAKIGFDTTKTVLSVNEENGLTPRDFTLEQNYPNPFNPTTTIKFRIAKKSNVTLKVYDALGKLVDTLVDEQKGAGNYSVVFNATNMASGVYFYELKAGSFEATKKLTILK